jgi:hypothetical protein
MRAGLGLLLIVPCATAFLPLPRLALSRPTTARTMAQDGATTTLQVRRLALWDTAVFCFLLYWIAYFDRLREILFGSLPSLWPKGL